MLYSRRHILTLFAAALLAPNTAKASAPRVIGWDDLMPPGVPYAQIIGEGFIDEQNDIWNPIYDENATKFNDKLNGALVKLPGFIIPVDFSRRGLKSFILVPYVGACIHTPPPPPNQLVFVKTKKPWPNDRLWDAVWVTGRMKTQMHAFNIANTGYLMQASAMETYEWD